MTFGALSLALMYLAVTSPTDVLIGVVIGVIAALALTRTMQAMLFGVSPADLVQAKHHYLLCHGGAAARR